MCRQRGGEFREAVHKPCAEWSVCDAVRPKWPKGVVRITGCVRGIRAIRRGLPARLREIDDGRGVVDADAAACGRQGLRVRTPRLVQPALRQRDEFRQLATYIAPTGVEFFSLQQRIEDAVLSRGVGAAASDPLPVE